MGALNKRPSLSINALYDSGDVARWNRCRGIRMATQTVGPQVEPRPIPWRLIGRVALGVFFVLFLALPLWNVLVAMASNPQLLARQLLIGLTNGAYIALIALGYTLVYGIVELINFAHGEVYMIGAFFR